MKHYIFAALFSTLFNISTAAAWDPSPKGPSQQAKEAKRWTLSQWMEQKGKIKWQDSWLHSNRNEPNYFEGYIGGEFAQYDRGSVTTLGGAIADDEFNSASGTAGLFIGWFGLTARFEDSSDEDRHTLEGMANLRLLGTSDQSSNFTIFYGARGEAFLGDKVLNQLAGGSMQLYLFNPWAVQGRYMHFFEADSDNGNAIDGYRVEVSTWVEWGAVRVYGTWFHEPLELSNSIGAMTTRRDGFNLGLRLYLDFKK